MNNKIVVIGSSNTDMVIKSGKLPLPGETVLGGTFMMNHGGKGANQAVAVARLGGAVSFVSKVGQDSFGEQTIKQLNTEGMDTDHIFIDTQNPSGIALITVDKNGENSIVVASGANGSLDIDDVKKIQDVIKQADILLMQLEVPIKTIEYAAQFANENGVKVILNPAPATFLSDSLLKCLYAIIPNETEAEILSGLKVTSWDSAREAANVIGEKGVDVVVITMGAKGALVKTGSSFFEVPSQKVQAVDTTAAGDTFCGAFCVALSEGASIEKAVEFANKAAAISVTREGAQNSIPCRSEVQL